MMKILLLTFFVLISIAGLAQQSATYVNRRASYENAENDYFSNDHDYYRISEVTINNDSTFKFWSRPYMSCSTWNDFTGNWKKVNDTITFYNQYEVQENDVRVKYYNSTEKYFSISIATDKGSVLRNRQLKLDFIYTYEAHIEDAEKTFNLPDDNILVIPFSDVKHLKKLSAIRIEYMLDNGKKRFDYLTKNQVVNEKVVDVPNVITVEFVEDPLKDTVYRQFKAVIISNTIRMLSSYKTVSSLFDDNYDLTFENQYEFDGYDKYKR
jgi:hypothetical protein